MLILLMKTYCHQLTNGPFLQLTSVRSKFNSNTQPIPPFKMSWHIFWTTLYKSIKRYFRKWYTLTSVMLKPLLYYWLRWATVTFYVSSPKLIYENCMVYRIRKGKDDNDISTTSLKYEYQFINKTVWYFMYFHFMWSIFYFM